MQAGYIGLMNAVRLWRPDAGATFRVFAYDKIRWSMLEQIRDSKPYSHTYWRRVLAPAGFEMQREISLDLLLEEHEDYERALAAEDHLVEETDEQLVIEGYVAWCREHDWFVTWPSTSKGKREEILRLWLVDGTTQAEISRQTGVSEHTVCITLDLLRERAVDYGREVGLAC
jgi:RNA polymerase sigma factor (sigma-70 family)